MLGVGLSSESRNGMVIEEGNLIVVVVVNVVLLILVFGVE